jgi:hypothetical protein
MMPQYDLHVLCLECGNFHDMLLRVSLDESFEVRNLSDVYDGKVPPEFYAAIAGQSCPKTKRLLSCQSPDQMVLVAVGFSPPTVKTMESKRSAEGSRENAAGKRR